MTAESRRHKAIRSELRGFRIDKPARAAAIRKARAAGIPLEDIAQDTGLTRQWVAEILKKGDQAAEES